MIMRKKILFFMLSILALIFLPNTVNASDMTSNLKITNALGDAVKFEKSYDSTNDVNNVHTVLTIDETLLNKVLSQKPGVGGNLGVFYVGITPQSFVGMPQHKQVNYYYTSGTEFSVVKQDLATRISTKSIDTSGDPSTWVYGVAAQYYKDSKWNIATGEGNGTISIGENLLNLLGLTSIDQLEYGVNYRLFMYENLDWYIQYQEVGNETNTEYVKVSYEIKFPVTAKMENGTSVYYSSLADALKSESKDIVINEDLTISSDVIIPEGVNVTIEDGVTITVEDSITNNGVLLNKGTISLGQTASIKNNGDVENNGTIVADKEIFTVKGSEGINLDSSLFKVGDSVEFTISKKDGFKVKSLKGVYSTGKEVDIKKQDGTYSFEMPEGNVTLSVEYEKISIKNPGTYDGIASYGVIGLISLLGLAATGICLKRKMN